jgi:hypothetical protein
LTIHLPISRSRSPAISHLHSVRHHKPVFLRVAIAPGNPHLIYRVLDALCAL